MAVVLQRPALLFLQIALLLLVCLLALDHAQEVVTLGLGLLGHHALALHKLLPAGMLEVGSHAQGLLPGQLLFAALLALALLEGTLGAQGVNLGLAVGGFLLHLAEAGHFAFFFIGDPSLFFSFGGFAGGLVLVVTDNHHFFVLLFTAVLLLLGECHLVCSLDLGDQAAVALALDLSLLDVVVLHHLDLAVQLLLLLSQQLALADTFALALLNLVDDHEGTLALGMSADLLALLGDL